MAEEKPEITEKAPQPDKTKKTEKAPPREISSKYRPRYLVFKHKKLSKKAKEYQHELTHLTYDLLEINRRLQKSVMIWQWLVEGMADKKKHHLTSPDEIYKAFDDITYHLENFIFRIHAYRDKMSMFINFALDLGCDEGTLGLLGIISKLKPVKDCHLDVELRKFNARPLNEFIKRRKELSHRVYYGKEGYRSLLPPSGSSKDDPRKMIRQWKKNVKPTAENANKAILNIRNLNERMTDKLLNYFKSNR